MRKQAFAGLLIGAAAVSGGCRSPLDPGAASHRALAAAQRQHLASVAQGPVVELSRPESDVASALTDAQRAELDAQSGAAAYADGPLPLGPGLTDPLGSDAPTEVVRLSLQRAIELGVRHNLDLQAARLSPAIAQTQLAQARARFDAVFFTDASWSKRDTPRPSGNVMGLVNNVMSEDLSATGGLRKALTTGGQIELSTTIERNDQVPSVFSPPRFYTAELGINLTQPLLRGMGTDVARAEIVLARSATEAQRQELRNQAMALAGAVEQAYWELVFTQQQLWIRHRLLERTVTERDRLVKRRGFDVSPVRVTQANSFVELRRADVIRARQDVRIASDNLKRLINAPDLPLASETLVLPVDRPAEAPITFHLAEAIRTALSERPELAQRLLAIDDASVRQRVADNARLPLLDLTAGIGYSGLDADAAADAYGELFEGGFIDYTLAARYEMPLGNRAAEARLLERRRQRDQAATAYLDQAQAVVVQVKDALRGVITAYQEIGATRSARREAANNLRAIREQEEAGVALTPEFLLDLKLDTQQRLAQAETQEARAMADYNIALTELRRGLGTILEHNRIALVTERAGPVGR